MMRSLGRTAPTVAPRGSSRVVDYRALMTNQGSNTVQTEGGAVPTAALSRWGSTFAGALTVGAASAGEALMRRYKGALCYSLKQGPNGTAGAACSLLQVQVGSLAPLQVRPYSAGLELVHELAAWRFSATIATTGHTANSTTADIGLILPYGGGATAQLGLAANNTTSGVGVVVRADGAGYRFVSRKNNAVLSADVDVTAFCNPLAEFNTFDFVFRPATFARDGGLSLYINKALALAYDYGAGTVLPTMDDGATSAFACIGMAPHIINGSTFGNGKGQALYCAGWRVTGAATVDDL